MREWLALNPELKEGGRGEALLLECAEEVCKIDRPATTGSARLQEVRATFLDRALEVAEEVQVLRVIFSALCDLSGQGWEVAIRDSRLAIRKPATLDDPLEEKARIRAGLLIERDRQLAQPSVQRFVAKMERRRVGPQGWDSIFSLMRSGTHLAARLEEIASLPEENRTQALSGVIQPYIQVVDDSACEFTGIPLKEIWRYFRYTWSSPHKTTPGRNIWFLIRDAAVDPHPVIGIAGLGSSVVQMGVRDDWIGWSRQRVIDDLRALPSDDWARWLSDQTDELIAQIYTSDFRDEGLLTEADLAAPDESVIEALKEVAKEERTKHRRYGSAGDHKRAAANKIEWEVRAKTPLFTWKRASTLADLLDARRSLLNGGFTSTTGAALAESLATAAGRRAFARILRRVKGVRVGHDILDITVCGAIPPYNHILGGKLVSLLLASPEVSAAYAEKYTDSPSIIASSMAGRAICRTPQLVMLGTTSLYGIGSSQYNRLRLPVSDFGGDAEYEIRYQELGITEGYGSFHFSDATMAEVRTLVAQRDGGRTVRYIFGEGTNPRMREVRGALDEVGLPSDDMLRHGTPRIIYAVGLARNLRDVLLGKELEPDYILPQKRPESVSNKIVDFWRERWLSMRITKGYVIERVRQHEKSLPVAHGARVQLPVTDDGVPPVR